MRYFLIVLCVVATLLTAGCAAKRAIVKNIQQDSVSVEVRESVVYITDTVEVAIPLISESVATRDTVSHLENAYAMSDAAVSGGTLFHSLSTKPQLRQVQIKTPQLRRDSIVYRNFTHNVEVEVERELSWLQKFQINGFWGMLIIMLLLILMRSAKGRV